MSTPRRPAEPALPAIYRPSQTTPHHTPQGERTMSNMTAPTCETTIVSRVGNPGRDAGSGSPGRGRAFPLWFGRGRDPCANPVAVAVAALDLGYPDNCGAIPQWPGRRDRRRGARACATESGCCRGSKCEPWFSFAGLSSTARGRSSRHGIAGTKLPAVIRTTFCMPCACRPRRDSTMMLWSLLAMMTSSARRSRHG